MIDLLVSAFAQTLDDAVVATPSDDNTKPLPPPLVFDQGMVRRARVGVPQHLVGGWKDDRDAAGSRLWNGAQQRGTRTCQDGFECMCLRQNEDGGREDKERPLWRSRSLWWAVIFCALWLGREG